MSVVNLPAHPAADLFPLLEGDELASLADDIRQRGLLEPIWLYDDPDLGTVILDGRNRLRACELAGVEVTTRTYTGDDPVGFVVSENVRRRHLTTGQRAMLAHEVEPLFAAQAARRRLSNRDRDTSKNVEADLPQRQPTEVDAPKRAPQARDEAGKTTGASGRAVAQAKRVVEQAPDLAEAVKAGDLALDRAERIIRDRDAEARRVAQARAEAAAANVATRAEIRHGDFRDVLADLTDVDAIITDPPYPAEHLPLLSDLADLADKILTPDGLLVVLIGQTHLPDVYRLLDGRRPYRWTACYLTTGAGYVSHPRRVQSQWKPLIVYGGGPRFSDVFRTEASDADAKNNHKWGQDYGAFHTIVERLTERGQTVVDPFAGSGTTLLAAHALGRHAIGAEIDADHVATARRRLS